MKSLTVQLPDDVYERAERRAGERGATLSSEVVDLVKHYGEGATGCAALNGAAQTSADLKRLFAALDAGRNVASAGDLKREELYDRSMVR